MTARDGPAALAKASTRGSSAWHGRQYDAQRLMTAGRVSVSSWTTPDPSRQSTDCDGSRIFVAAMTLEALAVGSRVAVAPPVVPAATVPGDARQLPARAGVPADDPHEDMVAR